MTDNSNGNDSVKPSAELKSRKYFEVFGDTVGLLNGFKLALALSLALNIFFILLLRRATSAPPMVIRIDSAGNPAIVESVNSQNISPQEVQNFATYFIEYWRGWDVYKYDDNFTRVWTMMTGGMQAASGKYLEETKVVDKITKERLKYKITLTEIRIKASDKKYVVVEITGTRNEGTYENTAAKDVRFIGTLTLAVVPRKVSVWGLMVDSYEERVFD